MYYKIVRCHLVINLKSLHIKLRHYYLFGGFILKVIGFHKGQAIAIKHIVRVNKVMVLYHGLCNKLLVSKFFHAFEICCSGYLYNILINDIQ